jgi:hypothetical protein
MTNEEPDIVDAQDGEIYTLSPEGVSKGMIPFHFLDRKTGTTSIKEPFMALGRRNLEFRRAEAEKAGFDFTECSGEGCPHHG